MRKTLKIFLWNKGVHRNCKKINPLEKVDYFYYTVNAFFCKNMG